MVSGFLGDFSTGEIVNLLLNGAALVVFLLVYLMLRPIHGLLKNLGGTLREVVNEMRQDRERRSGER